MLTAEQKRLIQETFAMAAPVADQVAARFYDRLFQIDPSLRPLFRGDIQDQGRKLMQALTLTVKSLDRLDMLVPVLQDLGRRHATYGVSGHHYDTVGQALIWTLERFLGDAFTEEARGAWVAAYQLVASVMQDATEAATLEMPARTRQNPAVVAV